MSRVVRAVGLSLYLGTAQASRERVFGVPLGLGADPEAKIVLVFLAGVTLLLGHHLMDSEHRKKTRHRPVVPSFGDDRLASGNPSNAWERQADLTWMRRR